MVAKRNVAKCHRAVARRSTVAHRRLVGVVASGILLVGLLFNPML
jgi:hypothetical protein